MYRSLSQDYQQVLPPRVRVRLLHRYRRTRPKILRHVQQQHDVIVQAFRYWETSCENPQKPKKTIKNMDIVLAPGNLLRDLPEWLERFHRKVIGRRSVSIKGTPANTYSERPAKVVSRKHSIFAHFPKSRICEVCKRAKIKMAPWTKTHW